MVQVEDCFQIAELPSQPAAADPGQGAVARPQRRRDRVRAVPEASETRLKPFLVLGLALGGVFAMSGVGLVVLYRATGVLNLAYGAIGATGALHLLVAASNGGSRPSGVAYLRLHRLRRRWPPSLYGVRVRAAVRAT